MCEPCSRDCFSVDLAQAIASEGKAIAEAKELSSRLETARVEIERLKKEKADIAINALSVDGELDAALLQVEQLRASVRCLCRNISPKTGDVELAPCEIHNAWMVSKLKGAVLQNDVLRKALDKIAMARVGGCSTGEAMSKAEAWAREALGAVAETRLSAKPGDNLQKEKRICVWCDRNESLPQPWGICEACRARAEASRASAEKRVRACIICGYQPKDATEALMSDRCGVCYTKLVNGMEKRIESGYLCLRCGLRCAENVPCPKCGG